MNVTKRNHTTIIHTCLWAVILLYCFLVAAGSDVTVFDADDDTVIDDSVRTLIDLEDLFDDELSSPTTSNSNDNNNNNNNIDDISNSNNGENDNIGDIEEIEPLPQSDNTLSTDWEEKRTKPYSYGGFSSDFSSLPSSAYNSSSKRFESPSDADLDANRQVFDWQEREDRDDMMEELFIPVPYDSPHSAILSRSKRDLTAGSGQELLKTELTADGNPTIQQVTDGTPENTQIRQEVDVSMKTYLESYYPGETFLVETTQVAQGSFIFFIDIVFNTDNLNIVDVARAYYELNILRTASRNYLILEQDLAPGTNSDDLQPSICYLCEVPQTCRGSLRTDGTGTTLWYCSTVSSFYFPFGTAQGDSTLPKGDEIATARINVFSKFPYITEFVSDVYISVNGLISLDAPFPSFDIRSLPVNSAKLLAPYWTDLDLLVGDSASDVFFQHYIKSATNTAAQQAVFAKANSDVVSQIQGVSFYDANDVIIVTWEAVPPWPGETSTTERVHFQATIITDGSSTFVAYVYANGGMKFDPVLNRRVEVGWGSVNFSPTPNPSYYRFDQIVGNTNLPGYWFFQIGERPNSRALCLSWFNSYNTPSYLLTIQIINFLLVPPCPCNGLIAFFNRFWLPSFEEPNCYDMFPLLGPLGRRCCYRLDGSLAYENRIPLAGSLQLFNPYFPQIGNYQNHEREEVVTKRWCCEESQLCNLYYALRPRRNCVGRRSVRSLLWGEPHIVTLDGKNYIFNGLGEYVILKVQGNYTVQTETNGTSIDTNQSINFELQGRTCRSRAASGNLTSATQWCALAGRDTDNSTFRVGLSPTDTYLEIYANNEDYSARFRDDPNFSAFEGSLSLRKINNSLSIFTPDNLGITVTLAGDIIEMIFDVNEDLKNLCSGLLGNFNGNSADDLRYRNDTVLADSASEEEIFDMGQSWAITQEESLFVYPFGTNTSYYSDPNFQPIFLDQVNETLRTEAEGVCNSETNNACIFDYIATQNSDLALQSGTTIVTFDEDEAKLNNEAPNITQDVEIETVVGEVSNFTLTAVDSDGDNITFIILQQPSEGDFVFTNDSGVFQASFTPASTNPVVISVVAQDSNGFQSEVSEVTIRNCGGCNGSGECNYTTFISENGVYYSVSPCTCELPYSGDNCQEDKNGCEMDPCPTGTNCTDIPADEEVALGRPYNCSDCPSGYRLTNDSTKCIDIDECSPGESNCDPNAACTNTIGSFFCTCNIGYRKEIQGEGCVDIDECIENSYKCAQICINTIGSYDCQCNDGFERSGQLNRNCTRLNVDPCDGLQAPNCSFACRNDSGTAQCFCEAGFRLLDDGVTCENINECADKLLCSQICTDSDGSYTCSCYAGYTLNVDEHDCDRCAEDRYGENCENECQCRGRATACDPVQGCICTEQWTGEDCTIDVNECLTDNICPEDKFCFNTNGSYVCSCPGGFEDANNNGSCTDIDECASASVNQCPQNCENNPGSFQCICTSGYNYNAVTNECDDINECDIGTSGCIQLCENTEGSFNCFCQPGYVLNVDRRECFRVEDLCTNKPEQCSHGCTVVDGQPTCICPIGFFLGTDSLTCFDVNECLNATLHSCSDFCNNTNGTYLCNCPPGKQLQNDLRTCTACDDYHWGPNCANECACNPIGTRICDPVAGCLCNPGRSGDQCQNDINECAVSVSPCPENSICTDIVGSYVCNCRNGYQLNASEECEDINECDDSPCDHICENTIGSYSCSCFPGFNPDGDRCNDINECNQPVDVHGCQQICRNTQGSYTCQCFEGFRLNTTNRRICVEEVDRTTCLENNTCDTGCRYENGEDICFCNPGFQLNSTNSSVCDDLDECTTSQPCDGGTCQNNEGGFTCSCEDGFRLSGDSITCLACEEGTYGSGCSGNCTCNLLNTLECSSVNGSCTCIDGYNGTDCETDIDECQNGEANCQVNSECENIGGSYRCVCEVGYATSGSECIPCSSTTYGVDCASPCSCEAANTVDCNDVNGTCSCKPEWRGVNCTEDVNECNDTVTDVCPEDNEYCVNLLGSFTCVCERGYTRITDVCVDINECLTVNDVCSSNQTCENGVGNFTCFCAPGFIDTSGTCLDVNECVENTDNCTSLHVCQNNVGSFTCECRDGYSEDNDGLCTDIDECQEQTDNCVSPRVCSNTVGNFICVCDRRFVENTEGVCEATAKFPNITLTFDIGDTPLDAATYTPGTPEYEEMAANIEKALLALGQGAVNDELHYVIVRDIRRDLVVDVEFGINELETDNTQGSAALVINAFNRADTVNISDALPSAPVSSVETNSTSVSADASVCSIFDRLKICEDGYECRIVNSVPTCQEKSDDNYELIIGLGVGIPLFILLVIIIGCLVFLCLRRSRSSERESTPSADRDAPFRSVFAGQMATKSSLGSPHRFSMYSPDAYSEAGTSESSGDGQLLKSRQKVRPDFQDSPWYDNRGATPREATESQGAPTEAGAGPTSNFSWEYMFRLLEPHRGFEIQRPNLSPAPNPTYTPRGKQSESPA